MRMVIDTDAGIDDAEALIMALTYPSVTIEAITTVTGNVHLENVNRNVCQVTDHAVHIPADISYFGKFGGFDLDKRRARKFG